MEIKSEIDLIFRDLKNEVITEKMAHEKIKKLLNLLEFIPYQECPICKGTGRIKVLGITTIIDEICPTCKSNRIIPMHKNKYHGKTNFT